MQFCIVGTGRCGSTFLKNVFNLHPDIFVFNETHWIPKMYDTFGTGKARPEELARILLNTYHITGQPVTQIDREQVLDLFEGKMEVTVTEFCNIVGMSFARSELKRNWADKTPDYGPWISIIQRLWPECKIIHLIRHGAATAISMSRHPGYKWMASAKEDNWTPAAFNKYYSAVPLGESPLEAFAELWFRRFQRIRNEAQLLKENTYREFHLESFVTEPELTLELMANFVNLSCPDSWIEQSKKILNIGRIRKTIPNMDFMGERELRLLYELGYQ
jgi:hypothetical protein